MLSRTITLLLGATFALASFDARAATLDDVKGRGVLKCGVAPNNPGFSLADSTGKIQGFDADFCYGLAAAIFGDKDKGQPTNATPRDAFTMLTTGAVDILTHRFTETFGRDNGSGVEFVLVSTYDGQGFIVRKDLKITSAKQLNGAQICVAEGTTTEINIADYFKSIGASYKIVTFDSIDSAKVGYDEGRCDAWSNDRASLASHTIALKDPNAHVILPEVISNEPIGPWVRQGDQAWAHTARWVFYGLIAAEESGITQANVEDMVKDSKDPAVQRLLGVSEDLGSKIGLPRDWAVKMIKAVGNYGEIYDRNLGSKSPFHLPRGPNALKKDGGMIYSPAFR